MSPATTLIVDLHPAYITTRVQVYQSARVILTPTDIAIYLTPAEPPLERATYTTYSPSNKDGRHEVTFPDGTTWEFWPQGGCGCGGGALRQYVPPWL